MKNNIKHLNAIIHMYVRKVKSWKVFDKPSIPISRGRARERVFKGNWI